MNYFLKYPIIFLFSIGLISCASAPTSDESVHDPLEVYNRAMFGFNDGLDKVLLKPVSRGYRFIAPDFVETGVSNVFSNIIELRTIVNSGLQGKGKKLLNHTGRFLINSTLGLAGILDVAKLIGLENDGDEDFGQTLAVWGVNSGPYVVLPLFGSSTFRDTAGMPIDIAADPTTYIKHVRTSNATSAVKLVDVRAGLLDAEKLISGDRYTFIRDAYLQRREFLIKDGVIEDSFSGDIPADADF